MQLFPGTVLYFSLLSRDLFWQNLDLFPVAVVSYLNGLSDCNLPLFSVLLALRTVHNPPGNLVTLVEMAGSAVHRGYITFLFLERTEAFLWSVSFRKCLWFLHPLNEISQESQNVHSLCFQPQKQMNAFDCPVEGKQPWVILLYIIRGIQMDTSIGQILAWC